MPRYLYVPYKKREIPNKYKSLLDQWIQSEVGQGREVIPCYAGAQSLSHLPQNAQIAILLPGKSGHPSPLSKGIPISSLRHWESLSQHLRLKDESVIHSNRNPNLRSRQNSISFLLPEVAEKMIADGLLERPFDYLNIQLCFLDAEFGSNTLAHAFFDTLLNSPAAQKGNIRLNYYDSKSPLPPHKINPITKKRIERSKTQEFIERLEQPTNSLFNNKDGGPQLSLTQLQEAIAEYHRYKSARLCGLSGILHLNGLFSSEASAKTLAHLNNSRLSDADRFKSASLFVGQFPNNYLAQCLQPLITNSIQLNHGRWAVELSKHNQENGMRMSVT